MKEEQRNDVLIENKIEDNVENGDEFETNKTMEIEAKVNGKEEATSDKENNSEEEIVDKREVEQENEEAPPVKKMKIDSDYDSEIPYKIPKKEDMEKTEKIDSNDYEQKNNMTNSVPNGCEVKKMRMMDSLPKGCEVKKMRMNDSLPNGCDGFGVKKEENGLPVRRARMMASIPRGCEWETNGDQADDVVTFVERDPGVLDYVMTTFNFKRANRWFKATDVLKQDLSKEEGMQHYDPTGWHPPKPLPPRRNYPPTKDLLGETPKGDETWVEPQTFYPTLEEFSNLTKYIEYMESVGAHRAGIAKIVPPKEWIPRAQGYNPADIEGIFIKPVQQDIAVTDIDGAFKTISDRSRPEIDVDGYRRLAISNKYMTPAHNSYEELEELYWKENIDDKSAAPIYGADVCDTITDYDQKAWNIRRLDSLLTEVMEEQIPGVNLPYLYFGMWKATFSWHVEDMDLYSVNYVHYGAPKTWYCIPPQFGWQLEQVAQKLFPDFATSCFNLLRHKAIMIGPKLLEANGVRVQKVVQEQRQMIIVFPHAYHSGFNHGFNMAESTNFAVRRWVEYGKRFRDCCCRDHEDDVSIRMDPFIKVVQPSRMHAWRYGKDYALHPEDPWYIRRCLQDAILRLTREEINHEEFEQLKMELKKKRQIPRWFKERFELDYDDQIDFVRPAPKVREEMADNNLSCPRVWSAKRSLMSKCEEGKKECDIKIKKLDKSTSDLYLMEMEAYNKMLSDADAVIEEEKQRIMAAIEAGGHGKGAAKGVGFAGVDDQELLDQKAKVTCKAKKQHRFNACKKCTGCRTENCTECEYCLDMPKYGGMGIMKQKCEKRICVNPQLKTCPQCVWNV